MMTCIGLQRFATSFDFNIILLLNRLRRHKIMIYTHSAFVGYGRTLHRAELADEIAQRID